MANALVAFFILISPIQAAAVERPPILNLPVQELWRCADRTAVVPWLQKRWGESLHAFALLSGTLTLETWVNLETGTWTLLQTTAGGNSCIVRVGTDWVDVPPPPPPSRQSRRE